jgi:DNA-binding protein HU-beta
MAKTAETLSKTALVALVSERAGLTVAQAKNAVDAVFDTVADTLAEGNRVTITGFGTFEVRNVSARVGVKPGTTEKISIPASKRVGFKPGTVLKGAVK